jgi:glycosyltransferase involved in cell wall biosynthesis
MTDLVSVVIPCYKDSATLGRAIKSVLGQTYPSIEIIVVNDCSPETEQIEACLAWFPQVRYLRNQVNVGLAATRNNGLAIASGKLVAFLDADDELHPQKIELQYPFVGENSVVACNVERVVTGEEVGSWRHYEKISAKAFRGARRLIYRNTITGASLMAPKSLLIKVGGYDNELRSCEDFDLWLRLLKENVEIRIIKLPLYRYYLSKDGLSRNFPGISNWEMQVLIKHFKREGVTLSESNWAARVWAIYILRQIARFEASKDERMVGLIDQHLAKLTNFPILSKILWLIRTSRLLKIYAWLAATVRF